MFDLIPPCVFPSILFGRYELPTGGKPNEIHVSWPIEWLILSSDPIQQKALLLSKYALDWEGYADCPILASRYKTTWEESYLRTWLNSEFYNQCFSASERSLIMPTYISPENRNGRRTFDSIFLLSAKEVQNYFKVPESAATYEPAVDPDFTHTPLDYSYIRACYYPCTWWTRTPGKTLDLVKCIDPSGSICELDSNSDEICVRPAMWIKTQALIGLQSFL